VMIGRPPIPIDVNDETPFISMRVGGDLGIFRLFAARIPFLRVVFDKVGEFACGGVSLGCPG